MRLIVTSRASGFLLAMRLRARRSGARSRGTVQDARAALSGGCDRWALNLGLGVSVSRSNRREGCLCFRSRAGRRRRARPHVCFAPRSSSAWKCFGQVKRLAFVLELAGVAERFVLGLDRRTCARARGKVQPPQDTIDLPAEGARLHDARKQARGANREPKLGGISIDGSSASEKSASCCYGVETTNPFSGVSGDACCGVRG